MNCHNDTKITVRNGPLYDGLRITLSDMGSFRHLHLYEIGNHDQFREVASRLQQLCPLCACQVRRVLPLTGVALLQLLVDRAVPAGALLHGE